MPYKWLDAARSSEAKKLMEEHECSAAQLPLIIFEDAEALCQPELKAVAAKNRFYSKKPAKTCTM